MKDNQNLDVTANNQIAIDIINKVTEILFRKKAGIDELLPNAADKHIDCPMLQIYTAIMFCFSFSKKIVEEKLSIYLDSLNSSLLNKREKLHKEALQALQKIDFYAALKSYEQITNKYPQDKVGILMLETCAFLAGEIDVLKKSYQYLFKFHTTDSDFLGMIAFLYCHLNRHQEASILVEKALTNDSHNAWLQHIYAHTINEKNSIAVTQGIIFLKNCADDWPKHSRFFEGHNWMHLCMLYLKHNCNPELIFNAYSEHIWGKAKEFNFEQNNAFLILWCTELADQKVDIKLWKDLAKYATLFIYDYFTPYLTITTILTVAKANGSSCAIEIVKDLEIYIKNLSSKTKSYQVWHNIALPALKGCLAYIDGDNRTACEFLETIYNITRPLGHSDEQRSIFPATYLKAKKLITNAVNS